MRPFVVLCRIHDGLSDFGYIVGALGLASMAIIYCYEVLTRYFLNMATDWANDTFANVLCVTIFAMVPHATRRAQHISITLLSEIVPKTGPALALFTAVVGTGMCLLAGWMSLEENIRQISMGLLAPLFTFFVPCLPTKRSGRCLGSRPIRDKPRFKQWNGG